MALLVTRAHHDAEATLEVVGRPVVPSYTAALHRFVDELGLRGAVTFAGAVSDEQLAAVMARSDVLVVTSQHEGFGVPVLEAMTLGLPVVANRVGALPEVVGDAGLLVDATDPYALAERRGPRARGRRPAPVPWRPRPAAGSARSTSPTAAERAVDLVAALAASSAASGADGLLHQGDEPLRGGRQVEAGRPLRPAAARTSRSVGSRRTRPTAAANGTADLSSSTSPASPTVSGTAVTP